MNPNAQVADLIMQLMMRGKAGGLPMQASPELTQYLAHAQGGTTPPQLRGQPAAEILQGPGSGAAAIRDPNFLPEGRYDKLPPEHPVEQSIRRERELREQRRFKALDEPNPLDMVTNQPASRTATSGTNTDQIFIWYTNPKTGKRIKLDGPFTNDLDARRAFNELRQSGLTDPLEISPY